jgi:pilus assembly protein CpaF
MVGMAGFDIPIWTIRRQIASSIHLVVQVARLVGGARKVVRISEITGMEGDTICMHDIFEYRQTGLDANRCAIGHFIATGLRPHCLDRLEASGVHLPMQLFEGRILNGGQQSNRASLR